MLQAPSGHYPPRASGANDPARARDLLVGPRDREERTCAIRSTSRSTEAEGALEALLRDAVKLRLESDVPLGAFLSGGIDSSTVVALMQAESARPVRTFTIGFRETGYDEAAHAKAVAKHLGTDHTELYVEPDDALDLIPKIPDWYDEPFADSSQLPTFLVSQMTRRHVTVALSGDGGDELFAGYDRYFWAESIWRAVGGIPERWRERLAGLLTRFSPATVDRIAAFVPSRWRPPHPGDKSQKLARTLRLDSVDAVYRRLLSHWEEPERLVLGATEPKGILWDESLAQDFLEFIPRAQFLDLVTYLPDDILTKVDRASMAVGLEARVPLLDHRVVELAWRLPFSLKVHERAAEVATPQGALALRAYRAGRAAEDGLWRADRHVAPRAAERLGRGSPRREAARPGGVLRSAARSREMARASLRAPQLALSSVGRPHVPGVEREMGMRSSPP